MVASAPVLVVEDEPLIMMLALDVLEDGGFTAYSAQNADEATQVLEEHPDVGLLFTDIDMPGSIDGLALASRVHARWPDVEIIVTSGKHWIADRDLPDHGHFIPKPYTPQQLLDVVEEKLS